MKKNIVTKAYKKAEIIYKPSNMFFWLPFDRIIGLKSRIWDCLITDETRLAKIAKYILTSMYYMKATKVVEKKNKLKKIMKSVTMFFDILPVLGCTNKLFEETYSYRLMFKFKHQYWNKPISNVNEVYNMKLLHDGLLFEIK